MIVNRKIRVLVVDDSAVARKMIVDILSADPRIEVIGAAEDAYNARDRILSTNPDVLTLDIEMPRMDGLTFLGILQKHRPIPVIVISALTPAGSKLALEALEGGAVEVLAKPGNQAELPRFADQLRRCVKGAADTRRREQVPPALGVPRLRAEATFQRRQIIVLGASTGGTEALKQVLTPLPAGLPGILIVQHIPPIFSKAFAERLSNVCAFPVREAQDKDLLTPGMALVAPGDYHMMATFKAGHYSITLRQSPPVQHVRPSVDVLFASIAQSPGVLAVGVVLTGMGVDGAAGLQRLKQAGARTIAQDEETSVVFGMPRAAIELGAVDQVLPLAAIPAAIVKAACAQAEEAELASTRSSPSANEGG